MMLRTDDDVAGIYSYSLKYFYAGYLADPFTKSDLLVTVLEVGSGNSTCLIVEEASSGSEENFPSY